MSFDWTHQFCLACDKQTDGTTYCSESCRLTEYDKTSASASQAGMGSPPRTQTSSRSLYLPPAFDFSNPRPYGNTPSASMSALRHYYMSTSADEPLRKSSNAGFGTATSSIGGTIALSPSNSHTSLCSLKSTSSTESSRQLLSDSSARELRAYARSFESVRLQRRRSH